MVLMERQGPSHLEYRERDSHWAYLEHPVYRAYQCIPKMYADKPGAVKLERLADMLSTETDPLFLDAAASAYLESSIVRDDLDTEKRMVLFSKAQFTWECALKNEETLLEIAPEMSSCVDEYRVATNLACLPMVKGLILGDVKSETIHDSINKLLQVADVCELQKHFAKQDGRQDSVGEYSGLQHEINALLAFLYQENPKFIALPSTARGGTGYFYREQTHDLTVISQHFGDVRSILPVEVKARASGRDRRRYKALIIRGKMHLSSPRWYAPELTKDALKRYFNGEVNEGDEAFVESLGQTISELTVNYRKRGKYKPLCKKNGKMSYYS